MLACVRLREIPPPRRPSAVITECASLAVATLNPAQQEAVEHEHGPALVIAGAGSGKTRVLTARVARLLERGVPAEAVLAFTFTNRAAREMRARIESELGPAAAGVWIGTFHATAVRILRREANTLGLPAGFTIYDRDDQEGIVRELIREAGLPEATYRTGVVLGRISDAKNALVLPAEAERAAVGDFERQVATLYGKYQAALRRAGALDFDDLIAETVRLWLDHPDAGARWSRRFHHVLVDEYQDWARATGTCSWSGTTTRASTAGAAPGSRTCSTSRTRFPAR